jgi:predicted nuclease with TOPRIM domain
VVPQIDNSKFIGRGWSGIKLGLEDKLMEILAGQRENVTTVNECKERNKTSMDEVCMKLDKLNEIMMKMQEEHERLRGLVNLWETKLKEMKQKCDFMDEWRRRNNILIFCIEECPHKTYFDILKITEDILKVKVKVETANWHIEKVHRL